MRGDSTWRSKEKHRKNISCKNDKTTSRQPPSFRRSKVFRRWVRLHTSLTLRLPNRIVRAVRWCGYYGCLARRGCYIQTQRAARLWRKYASRAIAKTPASGLVYPYENRGDLLIVVVQRLHFSESALFLALLRGEKCGHFRIRTACICARGVVWIHCPDVCFYLEI